MTVIAQQRSSRHWTELLPLLEKKYGLNKCYMFENNVFPNNVMLPPPKAQSQPKQDRWKEVPGVNILAHLYQEPIPEELLYMKFKIIVNPRAVSSVSVHGVLNSDHGCAWVDRNIARMYHTRDPMQTQLTSDMLIYDGRLLSYSDPLSLAVDIALRESTENLN
ncbi:hypothetical protein CRENBAI_009154 [Crenichthys baileyi]|uniref:Uncharacterized protein n=1 Tax=Crenichthys baileyi TaxID=28760 RepID=A0AAV9SKT6_9TELE